MTQVRSVAHVSGMERNLWNVTYVSRADALLGGDPGRIRI